MLTVQDINGLSTADTYVSTTELQSYASKRGIVLVSDPEQLLTKAMDYLSLKQFKGEPINPSQSTHYPVMGLGVPTKIKTAQMMLAVLADTQDLISAPSTQVKREKVDSIEVEYYETDDNSGIVLFPAIDALLAPYLDDGVVQGSGINFRVMRG